MSELMVSVKIEKEEECERKDPTTLLPEEPMSYQLKKKKKKKKHRQEDPFKDIKELFKPTEILVESSIYPEVDIKVENIEVELDFHDFKNHDGTLMVEGPHSEDNEEPAVKIEDQNHEATHLLFENIANKSIMEQREFNQNIPISTHPVHVCKVCHLIFQTSKTLRVHQRRMHKIYRKSFKHICDYCGMSYEQKNSLIAHIRRKHINSNADDGLERTCDICALVFKGLGRLRMHMRRKHGSFQESFTHVCQECGLTYDKNRSLIVHMQRKHSTVQKPAIEQWYSCPFCPKVFAKRETYARHMQRKHLVKDDNESRVSDSLDVKLENSTNHDTGEITCTECPLVFSSINFLKLHMRRKHNALKEDFRLKCKICNLSYSKVESLKRHVRRKHDRNMHCNVCNKQFSSRDRYLNHSHSNVINECSICGLIFASAGGLGKHMRCTHKIELPKVVFCNLCNAGFHDRRHLRPHLLKVHMKVQYTCIYCNKTFKAKESYRRHIIFKHPTSNSVSELQKCDQCSLTFTDEFELCRHVNLDHNEVKDENDLKIEKEDEKDPFRCTKCSDCYFTWEELRLHYEQNHYTVSETQCQMCGDMMPVTELNKHLKSHQTDPILQCKYCEFNTTVRLSMTQHLLRHRNATTLHCDFTNCTYKSFHQDAMEKHKRKHAELGVKLQCTKCPFQTMNKYILKYHEEAHTTGVKRYTCDQCDYATILPANLVQHKYKHSTEKRFKCEVCPFATKYNTSLRFHVKKKHCDLPTLV